MPERDRLLHLLAPDVKCPACGGDLTFVRVHVSGDLYQCNSGGHPKCQVLHYGRQKTKTCGYAVLSTHGALGVEAFGEWTACDMPAAKE